MDMAAAEDVWRSFSVYEYAQLRNKEIMGILHSFLYKMYKLNAKFIQFLRFAIAYIFII